MSSVQRDERIKGKGLMKPRGVTNLGAQVGGCAPDTQPHREPHRDGTRPVMVGDATGALRTTGLTDKRGQERPEPQFVTST